MLDENLPTFLFRPMPDTPSSSVVYFTRSGSDPRPEYVLRLADPASKPECHGVYAAALADPYLSSDMVYGEVAVRPQWQQPTLSAAELRELRERQAAQGASEPLPEAAPVPRVPDVFSVQLYNPDQTVAFRYTPRAWNRMEAWEFDVPRQSFRLPSASRLDREPAGGPAGLEASAESALQPKTTFRWKRDGRIGNKDMTCYMTSTPSSSSSSSGHHRRREPDITIAFYKHGRDPAVTIYEPNLQRVDVQDRKGLELLLLLGAEAIRDLYLAPRSDPFNLQGASAGAAPGPVRRRDTAGPTMHGVLPDAPVVMGNIPSAPTPAVTTPSAAAIDAETKRLQAMLSREERERELRLQEEERRIKKMLEAEEKEQRQRDADIARETERLRQMYGVQGQDLPSEHHPLAAPNKPPAPPPRPVSVGPAGRTSSGSGSGGVSGFFSALTPSAHRNRLSVDDRHARMQKKRSMYF